MTRILTAAAIVGALVLVLLGRLIPVPPLVTGEDGSRTDLVKTRNEATTLRYEFQKATLDYQHYLATHEIPNDGPNRLRADAAELKAGGNRQIILDRARDKTRRAIELGNAMIPYAVGGERFFGTLQDYDNNLMSWSRTLGPRSEELRRTTWPILEWIKRYPEQVSGGINRELQLVPATQVISTTRLLEKLAPQLDAPDANPATIYRIALAADDLWVAGKYIPPVDAFHDGYYSALRRYDGESLAVAATDDSPVSGTPIRARIGAVAITVVSLLALLLLFAPPAFWRRMLPVVGRITALRPRGRA
ncbi:MAG TPA: hypothetical protein VM536_08545 [Chloroflexia bacterium]|nr:hypothetical protein [Chloroflexia bacterium]